MANPKRRTSDESGFFTIFALGLCAMLIVTGLAIFSIWHGIDDRRQLAEMADGAATAGASQVDLTDFANNPEASKNGDAALDQDGTHGPPLDTAYVSAEAAARQYIIDRADTDNLNITGTPEVTGIYDAAGREIGIKVTLHADVRLGIVKSLNGGKDVHMTVSGTARPTVAQ